MTARERAELRRASRERFRLAVGLEREFGTRLAGVGRQIGQLVKGFQHKGVIDDVPALRASLEAYSVALEPWAASISQRLQAQLSQSNLRAWKQLSYEIGSTLQREIEQAPTGALQRQMVSERIQLIKSLPTDAAERVIGLTQEALVTGRRAQDIAEEIARQGQVSIGQAKRIARTEVSSGSSLLTQARATHIGSEGYIWRGIMDTDERPEHARLEGKFIPWNAPPIAGTGRGGVAVRYHAGQGPNCRCWPEVVIPDRI